MIHLLPYLEDLGQSQDEIRSGFDRDRKEFIYEIHSKTVYPCPDCNAQLIAQYVSRAGHLPSDRDSVRCPCCNEPSVSLRSASNPLVQVVDPSMPLH